MTNQNILNKTNCSEKLTPYISCEEEAVGIRAQISAWTETPSVIATKFQPDEEAEIPHVIGPDSPSFLSCNYL